MGRSSAQNAAIALCHEPIRNISLHIAVSGRSWDSCQRRKTCPSVSLPAFRQLSGDPTPADHQPAGSNALNSPRRHKLGSRLRTLEKCSIPFAVLGNNMVGNWQPADCDVVSSDDVNGAYELTCDLVARGHRAIWFMGDFQHPWYYHCAEGYRRAMADAGLRLRHHRHAPDIS